MTEFSNKKLDFNNINFNDLNTLLGVVNNSKKRDLNYLRSKYELRGSHFEDTLGFLMALGLIDKNNDSVFVPSHYQALDRNSLKSTITDLIFKNKSIKTHYLNDYLRRFQLKVGVYQFTPNHKQRTSTSGVRNLLISLGIVEYDANQKKYIITNLGTRYLKSDHAKNLTNKQLLRRLAEQEKIGLMAEKVILSYERNLLKNYSGLTSKIEHVSQSDVSAGYDIKSFRYIKGNKSEPKYIEVKAVSEVDKQFFWSRNEMEVAKIHKDMYYLYLLPIKNSKTFDLKNLKIIQNPYKTILRKKDKWDGTVELMSFKLH